MTATLTQAMPPDLVRLPEPFTGFELRILDALEIPVIAEWPDETTLLDAPQVWALLSVVLDAVHVELARARFGVCFRKDIQRKAMVVWAQISKASGKLAHFAALDLIIEVNWTVWRTLTGRQKLALLDHELCHVVKDLDAGTYGLIGHDLEEFIPIIRRWGAWNRSVRDFLLAAHQLDLFSAEADDDVALMDKHRSVEERVIDHLAENLDAAADQMAAGMDPDTSITISTQGKHATRRGRGSRSGR